MFDLIKKPILSSSTRLATLTLAALASAVIGACFNGDASVGLPCENDKQCGPGAGCIDGYCEGQFACASGDLIDASDVCDDTVDCEDGSDEDAALCGGGGEGINQCVEPAGDLSYRVGGSAPGSGDAIKVAAFNIMGTPVPDIITAGVNGDHLRIDFDLDTPNPQEYFVGGPPPSFGDRTVFTFETGDVNGDMKNDVLIMTIGSTAVGYVYQNNLPNPPTLYGSEIVVDTVVPVEPRAINLGRLDNDSSIDSVGVVDTDMIKGILLVSLGDSNAAENGESYFTPQLVEGIPINYSVYIDSAVADIDGDGLDDLLVVGARDMGGPALWFVRRNGSGDILDWDAPEIMPMMTPGMLAIGKITDAGQAGMPVGPMPDVAILDPMSGRIMTLLNTNGNLQPGVATTLNGAGYGHLTFADMNCDGYGDFVYNVTTPPEIRVLFGDGLGGVVSTDPLVYASEGSPRGGLDVALFDNDSAPDIFMSADPEGGLSSPEVRVLVTGAE